jgi:hypothetical protein
MKVKTQQDLRVLLRILALLFLAPVIFGGGYYLLSYMAPDIMIIAMYFFIMFMCIKIFWAKKYNIEGRWVVSSWVLCIVSFSLVELSLSGDFIGLLWFWALYIPPIFIFACIVAFFYDKAAQKNDDE